MTIQAGDPAPDVTARNQNGDAVTLEFDDPTVMYFYPRDGTPGCTLEAREFEAGIESFRQAGATVYGVSTDDVDAHRSFAAEHDVTYDLLADPNGEVLDAFGVERGPDGRARRTTFVLADGAIHRVYTGVSPDGHARDVLVDLLDDGLVSL